MSHKNPSKKQIVISTTQNLQYTESSCFSSNENMTVKQVKSIQRHIKPSGWSSSNNKLKQKIKKRIQLLQFNNKMIVINIKAKKFQKKIKSKETLLRWIQNLTYEPSSMWCSSKLTFVLFASSTSGNYI